MTLPAYLTQVMLDHPVGLWALTDAVGAGVAADINPTEFNPINPGTVSGTVTFGQAGPVSGLTAALFDGSTGRIDISPGAWDPSANKPFTVECIVTPAIVDTVFRRIGGREPVGNHGVMIAWHNTLHYYVGRGDSSAGIDTPSGGTPTVGVAAHICATYDSTTLKMAVNGVVGGSGSTPSSRLADVQTANLRIGGSVGGGTNGNATVFGFAVYNYALSPAQIAAHYQAWQAPAAEIYVPFPTGFQPWDIAAQYQIKAWYTENYQGAGLGIPPALRADAVIGLTDGSPALKYWILPSAITPSA